MPWDQFLMKKLLKSGVCESYEQCTSALFTREKSTITAGKKKKKKKRENAQGWNADAISRIQTDT